MKKLQNNFTTPEQSKRLLGLGVPADSADFYFEKCTGDICIIKKGTFSTFCDKSEIPCWSGMRLIEIITICSASTYTRLLFSRVDEHSNIENLIHYISSEIENGHVDFSKLEE